MNIAWNGIIIEFAVFILLGIIATIAINLYSKRTNKIETDINNQDEFKKS